MLRIMSYSRITVECHAAYNVIQYDQRTKPYYVYCRTVGSLQNVILCVMSYSRITVEYHAAYNVIQYDQRTKPYCVYCRTVGSLQNVILCVMSYSRITAECPIHRPILGTK